MIPDPDVLRTAREIMAVLGIGAKRYNTLLKAGLPVKREGKRHMASRRAVFAWLGTDEARQA